MRPQQSYTIWFSQRTGSTLLDYALSSTEVAGRPHEWLTFRDPNTITKEDLEYVWQQGTTPNGVFGLKTSFDSEWIRVFRNLYGVSEGASRATVWSEAFPNCNKHIYMTRRNKVRLAVSWWRAIVSGEWHRQSGEKPQEHDIADKYNFDAINHLFTECSFREAAIEDFLSEEGIIPLTIVYEDFILDYRGTVMKVFEFLNIPSDNVEIASPALERLADDVTEQWVRRFRQERQKDWERKAW